MEITQTKTGGIISWGEEDWLKGLVPYFQNASHSINGNGLSGFSWVRGIDPYYMPGSLWPSLKLTAQTNNSVIDAVQKNAITNGDQSYSVGGAKMHNFGSLTGTLTNNATFPHDISAAAGTHSGHTSLVAEDIIIYYVGSTKYAFYSFNDATDADVGRFNLSSTFNDAYMSGTAASGALLVSKTAPHPMVVGDDDMLYIADVNAAGNAVLHRFDGQTGANGTFSASKFVLPVGSIITSFSKIANFLVIYAYKPSTTTNGSYFKSEVRAYFWDYVSEDPTYSYPIQGNYINGGFTFKGQPGCFVNGVDPSFKGARSSKLIIFNGSQFEEVCSFPEFVPGHGGVETVANVIRWNSDGIIYQYGSMFGYPNALNRLLISAGTSSGGFLRNLASNLWFVSAGTTSSGGLESTLTEGFYTAAKVIVGQVLPPFPSGYMGRVTEVKAHWRYKKQNSGSTAKLTLNYQKDTSGISLTMDVFDHATTSTSNFVDQYRYAFPTLSTTVINLPKFSNIGWELNYTAGTASDQPDVLQRLEIHYENIKV